MARISSSAEGTAIITAFDHKEPLLSHISALEPGVSKANDDGTGNNPMITLEWTIDEAPFAGRRVQFHRCMIGGTTKAGKPMPLTQLLDVIDGCKIPWTSTKGGTLVARPFKKVKADDGSIIFVDPDTNTRIATIEYDTDDFLNKQAKVRYTIRKQDGSDRAFNEVQAVYPV
jgi:hypothetical protein